MPCRHLFNATTHEDRSTGILPNVPNDDDDDDDECLCCFTLCTVVRFLY